MLKEFEAKKAKLCEYVASQGLRYTPQREIILEEFLRRHRHITTDELWDRVRKIDPSIGYATVYRTLRLFIECGIADRHLFGQKGAHYEGATTSHHDHLVCVRCGDIIEFENDSIERLQKQVSKKHSFKMTSHKMEIYGYCQRCLRRPPKQT